MSGNQDVMATMGFTSFGQARRYTKQPKAKSTNLLPQLIHGTELITQRAAFSVNSVETGSHGVLYLLCASKDIDALKNALDGEKNSNKIITRQSMMPSALRLLQKLQQEKEKFSTMENSQFLIARAATNEFETLGKHRFLNRSAMKLVSLDYIFKWTYDQTVCGNVFSFADICGGPGGFSEYLLWRTGQRTTSGQRAHGYGITLKNASNSCDWRLPPEYRNSMTICYGEDETGNLYSIANIYTFRDVVRRRHPCGVKLVTADGGFLDARSQFNQEFMMNRLILAEVLAMYAVLQVNGDFVCKTFELVTPGMLELCWILHKSFERFAIVKPITSRPASSERYIVARGLRAGYPTSTLVACLENQLVQCNSDPGKGYELDLLPDKDLLYKDDNFYQYMMAATEAIARSQIQACRRINEYAANSKKRKSRKDKAIDARLYYECWQLDSASRKDHNKSSHIG